MRTFLSMLAILGFFALTGVALLAAFSLLYPSRASVPSAYSGCFSCPTETPCPPLPPTPVLDRHKAITMAEISKTLNDLPIIFCSGISADFLSSDYLNRLEGTYLAPTQGWVSSIEGDSGSNLYYVDVEPTDPWSADTSSGDRSSFAGFGVTLSAISPSKRQKFDLGQRIQFSGKIATIQEVYLPEQVIDPSAILQSPSRKEIAIIDPEIVLTEIGKPPPPSPEIDLNDMVISMSRSQCYGACSSYLVTIYGNGAVSYLGERDGHSRRTRTRTISNGKVRDLVNDFLAVRFFSIRSSYEEHEINDMPYTITTTISISMGGATKTVEHYRQDNSAPRFLHLLESKVDEAANTFQWLNEAPDPTESIP